MGRQAKTDLPSQRDLTVFTQTKQTGELFKIGGSHVEKKSSDPGSGCPSSRRCMCFRFDCDFHIGFAHQAQPSVALESWL